MEFYSKQNIHSFLKNKIPYYFLNKIEETNAVIGQQQLESYDQIINIFKNKNKEEKIESLKRNHIQKCIQWCEKNQIPHNKFTDKINIFLNTKREEGLKILEYSSSI
jgi:low affinity Fe/Cu permease